ncbi:hypothetical protein A0H81_13597 [Grifola frondosa]|uniref:C2H2-type domain-containing protein n=1 Tax=Grifola frondosa TaxID=5627 RepID=A0A1C7LRC9_GRIFR|nr:hypothetical protein A0H81_13597 [Grifola frondosa]
MASDLIFTDDYTCWLDSLCEMPSELSHAPPPRFTSDSDYFGCDHLSSAFDYGSGYLAPEFAQIPSFGLLRVPSPPRFSSVTGTPAQHGISLSQNDSPRVHVSSLLFPAIGSPSIPLPPSQLPFQDASPFNADLDPTLWSGHVASGVGSTLYRPVSLPAFAPAHETVQDTSCVSMLQVTEQRNLVNLDAGFTELPSANNMQFSELLISSPKPDMAVASGHSTVDAGAPGNQPMTVNGPEHIPSFSPSMTGCIAPAPAFSQNLAGKQDIISGTSRYSNAPKTARYSLYPTSLVPSSPSSPSSTSPSFSFLSSSSSSPSGSTSFVGKSSRAARQSIRRNKKAATVTIISTPEWLYCSECNYKVSVKRHSDIERHMTTHKRKVDYVCVGLPLEVIEEKKIAVDFRQCRQVGYLLMIQRHHPLFPELHFYHYVLSAASLNQTKQADRVAFHAFGRC